MNENTTIIDSGSITSKIICRAAEQFRTPFYLYDEEIIKKKCSEILHMPNAFGLNVRYAMKANPTKALLQLITGKGLDLDLSSMNEGKRANLAGIPFSKMMLTTQEVYFGNELNELHEMIRKGLKYNVCSVQQLSLIADFSLEHRVPLSIRIHPGIGSGESITRNTGDKYSCFGVHLSDLDKVLILVKEKNLIIDQVHIHIGSGSDPVKWQQNVDMALHLVDNFFPDVQKVNLGGGFRVARMPDEKPANIYDLGMYAKQKFQKFYKRTNKKLEMEVEPGNFIVANAGNLVTKVIDKKSTGYDGYGFVIVDGGMESNTRPLLYGSQHPFFLVSKTGELLSSDLHSNGYIRVKVPLIVVGKCCETGDSHSIDMDGNILPRKIADPWIGDYLVIGCTGAYCSSMSLVNYNSHTQPAEVLLRKDGELQLIRKSQILEQIISNECPLVDYMTTETIK